MIISRKILTNQPNMLYRTKFDRLLYADIRSDTTADRSGKALIFADLELYAGLNAIVIKNLRNVRGVRLLHQCHQKFFQIFLKIIEVIKSDICLDARIF